MAANPQPPPYPDASEQEGIYSKAEALLDVLEAVERMDPARLDMFAWKLKHSQTTAWARAECLRVVRSRLEHVRKEEKKSVEDINED